MTNANQGANMIEIRLGAITFTAVVSGTGSILSARAVDQAAIFTSLNGGQTWRMVRGEMVR